MGRFWAWSGIALVFVAVLTWSMPAHAQVVYNFPGTTGTGSVANPFTINFGDTVIVEETAVIPAVFQLSTYFRFDPDPVGKMKFMFEDARNRLVFSSQINVEFSGDTVSIDLTPKNDPPTDGYYEYGPEPAPFTVSFRPNEKGLFVDTIAFKVIYPLPTAPPSGYSAADSTFRVIVRGTGIGFLVFEPEVLNWNIAPENEPPDTTRVGGSFDRNIRISNRSTDRVGKVLDATSTDLTLFHADNPQLEVLPGQTGIIRVLYTPRALAADTESVLLISNDFAVDTPAVGAVGRGKLPVNYFTQDPDSVDGVAIHKVLDSMRVRTRTAGIQVDSVNWVGRDTLIWIKNRLNKQMTVALVLQKSDGFKLIRESGSFHFEYEQLIPTNDTVEYALVKYRVGDTIYSGGDPYVVQPGPGGTILPASRKQTLQLNDSMRVWLRFKPGLRGTFKDTILTYFNPFLSTQIVEGKFGIQGTAIGPQFSINKTTIDFGPLTPGFSLVDSVQITNSGEVADNINIDDADLDPVFTLFNTEASFTLDGIEDEEGVHSKQIYWRYSPPVGDTSYHEDTVTITSSDPNNPVTLLVLKGGTQAPVMIVSPDDSIGFGEVVQGDTLSDTIYIGNRGLVDLAVDSVPSSSTVFTVTPTAFTLARGDSLAVVVTFVPVATIAYSGTLQFWSNDSAHLPLNVAVTGTGSSPEISTDASLTFGATTLGGFLLDSVRVQNQGSGFLIVQPTFVQGTYFSLADPSQSIVFIPGGNAVRYIRIRFNQDTTSQVFDSLLLTTNDPDEGEGTVYVALSGGGFFKQLVWVDGPLETDSVYRFGKVSAEVPETLTSVMSNVGNDTVHVTGMSFVSGAQGFSRITPSTAAILQNELFSITIVFDPPDSGQFYDTLTIFTDDTTSGNDTIVVALEGTGFIPGLQPQPTSLVFDTTAVGAVAADSVGFANTADITVGVTSVELSQGIRFRLVDTLNSLTSVGGGTTAYVVIEFNPTDTLTYADTLVLVTSNPVATILVPLEGSGAGGLYSDNVDSLKFPPAEQFSSSMRSFTVRNVGNRTLNITEIKPQNLDGSGTFTRLSPSSLTLATGEQSTVTMSFQPLLSLAYEDTLLLLTSDPANDTVRIPMYGETPDPDIDFNPGRLVQQSDTVFAFPPTPVGSSLNLSLGVYNVGLDTLKISRLGLRSNATGTPSQFTATTRLNLNVPPGDSVLYSVGFRPLEKISYVDTVLIFSNDPDEDTLYIPVTGSGVSGQLTLLGPATSFDFGAVKIGTKDTSDAIKIQNTYGQRFRLTRGQLNTPNPEFVVQAAVHRTTTVDSLRQFKILDTLNLPFLNNTDSTVISVRLIYSPVDAGSDNNVFELRGTEDNAGDTILIPVTARGAAPSVVLIPNFLEYGVLSVDASLAQSITVANSGTDTLRITSMTAINAGAAAYTAEPDISTWIVPPGGDGVFSVRAKPTARKIYYDTLAFANNDPNNDPVYLYTRVVGIAPGDIGFVDTVRVAEPESELGSVFVPVHLAFDEVLKRVSVPLRYSSDVYECVGFDFHNTLLEEVDGRLPTIDTVNNIAVITATAIFSDPIERSGLIGTLLARVEFKAKPGVTVSDSTITIDTVTTRDGFGNVVATLMLQDTAQNTILPEFVGGRRDVITDVDDDGTRPVAYELEQNFPNPFNPATTIAFAIPRTSYVHLVVFNLLGQRVLTLVDDVLPPGRREIEWNGRDENGRVVSSGIYFYRLSSDEFSETRKMVLMK
jgi:hypothetical protein